MEYENKRKLLKPIPSREEVIASISNYWGMRVDEASLKQLPSYDDCNYYFSSLPNGNGESGEYLIKFYNGADTDSNLEGYSAFFQFLQEQSSGLLTVPRLKLSTMGNGLEYLAHCDVIDGTKHKIAMLVLSWISGVTMCQSGCNASLLAGIGLALGELDSRLKSFDHPYFHRTHGWDARNFLTTAEHVHLISETSIQRLVLAVHEDFQREVAPVADRIPASIIMGDCNDANVVVTEDGQLIAGIIDFGDACVTWTVTEIAIAMAYGLVTIYGRSEPVMTLGCLLHGYLSINPLSELELRLLRTLIAVRLSASITLGALSMSRDPTNEYLRLHCLPAKQALSLLSACSSSRLTEMFMEISVNCAHRDGSWTKEEILKSCMKLKESYRDIDSCSVSVPN